MQDYEPFGPEWKKELMTFKKEHLIDLFKNKCIEYANLEKSCNKVKRPGSICPMCKCQGIQSSYIDVSKYY